MAQPRGSEEASDAEPRSKERTTKSRRTKGHDGDEPEVSGRKGEGQRPGLNYFEDASSIPAKFAAKRGGSMFLELNVYPDFATAQLQDPAKRENVDSFLLRNGEVTESGPVKFMGGRPPTAKDLDETCIDGKTIDFAVVPKIAKDALAQTKIEDGTVSLITFKRWRPFSNDPRWKVFVRGPRKDGSVEYDAKGKLLSMH